MTSVACSHLLGTPNTNFHHEDMDSQVKRDVFFKKLLEADKRDYTILGSTKGSGEVESAEGILSGHAYSVIAIA
jgi:hypothetical protein